MIAELGHFALTLALALAVVQVVFPLIGAHRGNVTFMAIAKPAARAQCLFVALAFAALAWAFADNDFSVAYVATNSNSALPLAYRLSAIWGAHEGSLLLWVMILAVWTTAVTYKSKGLPAGFVARVIAIMGIVSAGFLLFMLFTSNPFLRQIPPPLDGSDLNPLLQDPGLIIHPPVLYTGYVGFSVAFSFAVAALLGGHLDSAWARWVRPWTILAWVFLTFGIALGSWWAYYELGWGGWWFWDPVENASFMPWLLGTALIHSLAATEKREVFKNWTVLLAISVFGLSLLGTFLVRSGVLTSVHAFATDPARGVFILAFLGLVVGGALGLYAWRGPRSFASQGFAPTSRETFLLANSVFLSVATATVLLGTLYPLAIDALGMGKISVGPPYFNAVFIPVMAPLVILLGVGQFARWKQDSMRRLLLRLKYPALASTVIAAGAASMLGTVAGLEAVLGVCLAAWIVSSTVQGIVRRCRARQQPVYALLNLPPSFVGQTLAHTGFAITIVGISMVSVLGVDKHIRMAPGDTVEFSGYEFRFAQTRDIVGPNYTGTEAQFVVWRDGAVLTTLAAQKRHYTVRTATMTEAGIAPGFTRDLYVSLGEKLDGKAWSVRISVKPFVRWLWLGAMCMGAGGFVAILDRRFRRLARRSARKAPGAATAVARG